MPHATLTSDCASHAARPVSPSTSATRAVHWHQPVTRAAETTDNAGGSAQRWSVDAIQALLDLPFLDLLHQAQTVHRAHWPAGEIELAGVVAHLGAGGKAEHARG